MSKPNIDLQAPQANTKEQVNYRQYESCATCSNYNGRVACNEVSGHISAGAVCDLWTMHEPSTNLTGKEVIVKAYEKEQERKGG